MASWETRNEDYLKEIDSDETLSDAEYFEVLDDLINRAESAQSAKEAEMADENEEGE